MEVVVVVPLRDITCSLTNNDMFAIEALGFTLFTVVQHSISASTVLTYYSTRADIEDIMYDLIDSDSDWLTEEVGEDTNDSVNRFNLISVVVDLSIRICEHYIGFMSYQGLVLGGVPKIVDMHPDRAVVILLN